MTIDQGTLSFPFSWLAMLSSPSGAAAAAAGLAVVADFRFPFVAGPFAAGLARACGAGVTQNDSGAAPEPTPGCWLGSAAAVPTNTSTASIAAHVRDSRCRGMPSFLRLSSIAPPGPPAVLRRWSRSRMPLLLPPRQRPLKAHSTRAGTECCLRPLRPAPCVRRTPPASTAACRPAGAFRSAPSAARFGHSTQASQTPTVTTTRRSQSNNRSGPARSDGTPAPARCSVSPPSRRRSMPAASSAAPCVCSTTSNSPQQNCSAPTFSGTSSVTAHRAFDRLAGLQAQQVAHFEAGQRKAHREHRGQPRDHRPGRMLLHRPHRRS